MVVLVKGAEFKDLLKEKMDAKEKTVSIPWLLQNTHPGARAHGSSTAGIRVIV
jgi:hypothetical protein